MLNNMVFIFSLFLTYFSYIFLSTQPSHVNYCNASDYEESVTDPTWRRDGWRLPVVRNVPCEADPDGQYGRAPEGEVAARRAAAVYRSRSVGRSDRWYLK